VRESDLCGPFRVAAANRLGLRPPFLRDRPAVPQSEDVRTWCDRHGIPIGAVAPIARSWISKDSGTRARLSGLAKMDRARSREISAKSGSSAISAEIPQPKEVF